MSSPELAQEAREQIRTAFNTLKGAKSPRPRDFVKAQKLLAAAYKALQASAAGERSQTAAKPATKTATKPATKTATKTAAKPAAS